MPAAGLSWSACRTDRLISGAIGMPPRFPGELNILCRRRTCSEDAGTALDGALAGGRFELMQQRLTVGGRDITLVVPRDVDAVMQMYIDAGEPHGGGMCLSNHAPALHTSIRLVADGGAP